MSDIDTGGYGWKHFQTDKPFKKRRYYTKDGREMILPGDDYSLDIYLKKGFTLTPPAQKTVGENESVIPAKTELRCPECGYFAKDHVGLGIHRRKAHHPKKK